MTKLNKTIEIKADYEKIIQIVSDIKNADKLLSAFNFENKIKAISENKAIVEETVKFPIIKNRINQETSYEFTKLKETEIKINSGPFKKTIIKLQYEKIPTGTKVYVKGKLEVIFKYSFFKSLIKTRILNNITSIIEQLNRLAVLTKGKTWNESVIENGDGIRISYENHFVIIYGWNRSSFGEIFYDESYSMLPVKDKTVVDIGANIGDSCIYFILKGAKKVIGIEPFPSNFELAKKNIEKNNLNDKIDLYLNAITKNKRKISVDSNYMGTGPGDSLVGHGTSIKNCVDGIEINAITLEDVISKNNVTDAVLKVDCEGCEYDIFLNSSNELIRNFSHIIIEFHKGFKDLKKKLEEAHYSVEVNSSTKKITGFLYAVRND